LKEHGALLRECRALLREYGEDLVKEYGAFAENVSLF